MPLPLLLLSLFLDYTTRTPLTRGIAEWHMSFLKHLSFLVLYHLHTRHIASPPLSGCHCSRHKGALLRLRTCRLRARSR